MWQQSLKLSLVVGVYLGFTSIAAAQNRLANASACLVLEDIVYSSVAESTLQSGFTARFPRGGIGRQWCMHTAKSVSAGFAKAMSAINIYIAWQSAGRFPDSDCKSLDLNRCYPFQDPNVPYEPGNEAIVRASWFAVQRALEPYLKQDKRRDFVLFSAADLQLQLQREMSRTLRGGSQEYYF
jgi:hypothetical protein